MESIEVFLNNEVWTVKVEYEWRPLACTKCGTFGHNCASPRALAVPARRAPIPEDDAHNSPIPKGDKWEVVQKRHSGMHQENQPKSPSLSPRSNHSPEVLGEQTLPNPAISPASSPASSDKDVSEDDKISSIGSSVEEDSPVLPTSCMDHKELTKAETSVPVCIPAAPDPSPELLVIPNKASPSPAAKVATPKTRRKGGILETKIIQSLFESTSAELLPGWDWVSNYEFSPRGRIWVGWNPHEIQMQVLSMSSQAIHGQVNLQDLNKTCIISIIYGEHTFVNRRSLWTDLIHSSSVFASLPWLVAGDFNAIHHPSDRTRSSNAWIPAFNELGDCLDQAGLEDLRFVGHRFTWLNSASVNRKQRKIDRVIINDQWSSEFSFSETSFIAPGISDHTPMIVRVLPQQPSRKPFKFFNFWMSHPSFESTVKQVWDLAISRSPLFGLCSKLKMLKARLKLLNRESFSDISTRTAQARHLQNRILSISDDAGAIIREPALIQQHIVSYFENLLAVDSSIIRPDISTIRPMLQHILDDNQILLLSRQVTDIEIQNSMFSLAKGKAPGPNGFNADFVKSNWDIAGPSVISAVRDFFRSGTLLRELNCTIVTLVPKSPNASSMKDFRPIACCNTVYKCISKLLAIRISSVLPSLISHSQNAFVKKRRITDNIMLAQELFAGFHRHPYLPKCAIKVDFRKAYDTLDWGFLELLLQAFSFPPHMVKLIMACVNTPKFSVAINGEMHGFFASGRGIRQGDPLSPYLFTLVMEVFSGILDAQTQSAPFKFFWRCKATRLSHLYFADDVLLFSEANMASIALLKEGLDTFSDTLEFLLLPLDSPRLIAIA
ncbi:uncharacterized protein LOC115678577 [Syzygium oleosum]|uniref:uncharacterized protein LOC115678577 n=1 Tax=Syzygium oleosum TaxID=219896 RepID=UPI0024BB8799|nr:uncharacterized protein LOC115678577 [Syzygium oleosum]